MRYLRTNTATRITVGPFIGTDGLTPKTSLTVTNEKLTFLVDDGGVPTLVLDTSPTASSGNNDMVHVTGDDAGFYDLELTAANVNYLGRAMISLTDLANHAPVFHEFMILPANVYDAIILGTDLLDVSTVQFAGSNLTQSGGRPEVNTSHAGGTAWGSGAITSSAFASGAINASAIAADAIGASELAADAATEIATAVWASGTRVLTANTNLNDLNAAGIRSAVGLASANLDTQLSAIDDFLDTEIAAILADTNELQSDWANGGRLDLILDAAAALITTAMTESYASLGAAQTPAQILYEIRAMLAEKTVSGTTLTTKKLNGSTTARTYTLNDNTSPTAITTAS